MRKFLILVSALFLFTGCFSGFNDIPKLADPEHPPVINPDYPPAEQGMGYVQIIMGRNSRTLLPTAFDLYQLYFVLSFTPDEGEEVSVILDQDIAVSVQLPIGVWYLDVKGYNSEYDASDPENAYVSGTETINISLGEIITVNVVLSPDESKLSQSENGILRFDINIPAGATGTLTVYTQEDESIAAFVSFSATEFCSDDLTLESGFYYVSIVTKLNGREQVWRELAHIYDKAITELTETFLEENYINFASGTITRFSFSLASEYVFIDHVVKIIGVFLPSDTDLGALIPDLDFTGVMIDPPLMGEAMDFTDPVSYTIYTEDGTVSIYTVSALSVIFDTVLLHDYLSYLPANTEDNPYPVKVNIDLDSYWPDLLEALYLAEKYIVLDISDSTGMETFTPGPGWIGKEYIVSLMLPDTSTVITTGSPGVSAFNNFTSLRSMSGKNITELGDYAFYNQTLLEYVDLPALASIGNFAFRGCTALTDISIPESVSEIGNAVFSGCADISVTICTDSVKNWSPVFSNTTGLTIILDSNVSSIGDDAFYDCASLIAISIPGSVNEIGESAFYNCAGLTEISIPASVSSIGEYAFYGCTGLSEIQVDPFNADYISIDGILYDKYVITLIVCPAGRQAAVNIPGSVSTIEDLAFSGCSLLRSVTIPKYLTDIGTTPFSGCADLTVTIFTDYIKTWAPVFTNTAGLSVIFENGVTSIGNSAFSGCTQLLGVTIPVGVTSIGNAAFSGCIGLDSVSIPATVASIGDDAFGSCANLSVIVYTDHVKTWTQIFTNSTGLSVILEDGITGIGFSAFSSITGLISIVIPDSVLIIESYAFSGCTGLTQVSIPDSITAVGNYTFYGCTALANVTLSQSMVTIGSSIFQNCSALTNITIPQGVNIIWDSAFQNCIKLTSITIPEGVTSIRNSAFYGCTGLNTVLIPASVSSIESSAFGGCANVTITIQTDSVKTWTPIFTNTTGLAVVFENSVTSIGASAFSGCTGLVTITLPNSISSIGTYAFDGCTRLSRVVIPGSVSAIEPFSFSNCSQLTNVTISEGVTIIGINAFENCTRLTSVTIPASVSIIANYAFYQCFALNSVRLAGDIDPENFSNYGSFPGNLRISYYSPYGGPGTYTCSNPGELAMWAKR